MRVGLFTNAYRPVVSGVVNSVDLIRKGLLRNGHNAFVFAPQVPGFREQHAGVWRFRSLSLTRNVEFPLPIPYSTRIFPLIPKLRLDVIHTHHPFLLGEVGAHFAKKLGIPLVYTFHTQLEKYSHYVPLPQDLVRMAAREYVAAYARKCDCIICPSPSIRGLLDEYGVTCRVEVLQNAVDLRAYRRADGSGVRARLGLTPERVLCIYTGRMGIEKNLSFMLQAFRTVHRQHPEAALMLVGDGPLLEDLQREAADLGIAQHVLFPGRVAYREIPSYYAASNLFVMTSTTEVKPLAVLEGMATGLPVVAVEACGTGDTVTSGHDGLLCDCDQEAFAGILRTAVADAALRRRLGEAARVTAEDYSLENYARRLVDLYREVGAGSHPGG